MSPGKRPSHQGQTGGKGKEPMSAYDYDYDEDTGFYQEGPYHYGTDTSAYSAPGPSAGYVTMADLEINPAGALLAGPSATGGDGENLSA